MVYHVMYKQNKNNLGEGLYTHANFIVDNSKILSKDCQDVIRDYYYSKISNTPPFPSIKETPEEYIDNFFIVEEEVKSIAKSLERNK